jgi:hypothetical protein
MPKLLGLVVSFVVSLGMIQIVANAFQVQALSLQRVDWSPHPAPRGPVHEVDRDVSAGAMFT